MVSNEYVGVAEIPGYGVYADEAVAGLGVVGRRVVDGVEACDEILVD